MTVEFLKTHAAHLRSTAEKTVERSNARPQDFWLLAAAENQTQAARDAQREFDLALAAEAGELVDLRFLGPKADGSIPLEAFFRIAGPLSKAWKAAAYRLRHGTNEGRMTSEISDSLNLKLAGMAPGSTHIFISGNATADTTGESLFRITLNQTFRLLESNNDEFYDAVDAIGGRAAQHMRDAMKAIDAYGFSAEFSWRDSQTHHRWQGTSDEVIRVKTLLDAVSESETYIETITGFVAGIFDNGKLDLRTANGRVRIRYPMDLTPEVQKLSIATPTSLRVQTTKYVDPITHTDFYKRHLVSGEGDGDLISQ